MLFKLTSFGEQEPTPPPPPPPSRAFFDFSPIVHIDSFEYQDGVSLSTRPRAPPSEDPPRAFFTFGPTYHVPRPNPRRTSRRDFQPASPEAREELFNHRTRPTTTRVPAPTSETNSPGAETYHPGLGVSTSSSGAPQSASDDSKFTLADSESILDDAASSWDEVQSILDASDRLSTAIGSIIGTLLTIKIGLWFLRVLGLTPRKHPF
ncbi:hypothetical protein BU16DRAFT_544492 [Lophium mytilinum]|uniref:Uncharacterized protein n=1 Tax=Lophium mytilinum TaxID=390894 RepID=A0A6A6QBQ9_9PEZI|nr:hypothetical protein BU16DRAFT_544492 [Lophium mytilinum]